MSGMSAADAKKGAKKPREQRGEAATVYTINGQQHTFAQVVELVHAYDRTAVVAEKTIKARLDRGHRDLKVLAADRLPHFRPTALRGRAR